MTRTFNKTSIYLLLKYLPPQKRKKKKRMRKKRFFKRKFYSKKYLKRKLYLSKKKKERERAIMLRDISIRGKEVKRISYDKIKRMGTFNENDSLRRLIKKTRRKEELLDEVVERQQYRWLNVKLKRIKKKNKIKNRVDSKLRLRRSLFITARRYKKFKKHKDESVISMLRARI